MRWASKFLLIIAIGIVSYTGILFGGDLYRYLSLSSRSTVKVAHWAVKELGEEAFAVEATFMARGKEHHYQFVKPIFKNKFIANEHIELWKKGEWEVFSDPTQEIFVLQKFFPFKTGFHFILSLGVILWFAYLFQASYIYRQGI